jgi:hypothetical protein
LRQAHPRLGRSLAASLRSPHGPATVLTCPLPFPFRRRVVDRGPVYCELQHIEVEVFFVPQWFGGVRLVMLNRLATGPA